MNLKRNILIARLFSLVFILAILQSCENAKSAKINLIFTSSMLGYVESCGCGYDRGGFDRRSTLIDSLRNTKNIDKTFLIDTGNNLVLDNDLMLQKKYIPQVLNFLNYACQK